MAIKKQARELSRGGFQVTGTDDHTWEDGDLNVGSLQRIADAVEKMAQNVAQLEADRDLCKRRAQMHEARCEKWMRRYCALRGVITKMKKAKGE